MIDGDAVGAVRPASRHQVSIGIDRQGEDIVQRAFPAGGRSNVRPGTLTGSEAGDRGTCRGRSEFDLAISPFRARGGKSYRYGFSLPGGERERSTPADDRERFTALGDISRKSATA